VSRGVAAAACDVPRERGTPEDIAGMIAWMRAIQVRTVSGGYEPRDVRSADELEAVRAHDT
jgi:hypothetical protein